MKLFSDRAVDYFRSASPDDRRYLLFNPMTKMKVTTEGERVDRPALGRDRRQGLREGHLLRRGRPRHPRPAEARGHGARQPGADPEVHAELPVRRRPSYPPVPHPRTTPADDEFLFRQGPARGLGKIRFDDWRAAYEQYADCPNVARFPSRPTGSATLLADARRRTRTQQRDLDFLLDPRPAVHAGRLRPADPGAGRADRARRRRARPDLRRPGPRLLRATPSSCTASRRRPSAAGAGRWRTSAARSRDADRVRPGLGSGSAPSPAPTRCAPDQPPVDC